MPGDRTKNEEPTIMPLSTIALDILRSVPRLNDTFVFPAKGNEESHFPVTRKQEGSWTQDRVDGKPLENWTQHDLRRTLATNLGKTAGVPISFKHILNHQAASMSAVAKIYNRYQYLDEKRAAAQLWSDHIEGSARKKVQQKEAA